jgi:23S rRNA (cytosine1962-C5)-methyltransferase
MAPFFLIITNIQGLHSEFTPIFLPASYYDLIFIFVSNILVSVLKYIYYSNFYWKLFNIFAKKAWNKMNFILNQVKNNFKDTEQSYRVFHGRGGLYADYSHLTIDWFAPVFYVKFYSEDKLGEIQLPKLLKEKFNKPVVLHKRYENTFTYFDISEEEALQIPAVEGELKYKLKMGVNQNYGFFLDMKEGRNWFTQKVKEIEGAKVLNLFAYTCSFSVVAKHYGASEVHNVDVSKSFLEWGRENHQLNEISTEGVFFHRKNVLKSLGWLAKKGPYDIVVYDPPSYQKSRFDYVKDYSKVVRQLGKLVKPGGFVMSCLNTPFEKSGFIVDLYRNELQDFDYVNTLYSPVEYEEENKENGVKVCIFQRR